MDKRQFLEQTIDSVRSLDITSVMSRHMQLTKRAGNHLGICPFHNDRTIGSFVASAKKGIFKCFSCGVGGDAIKFVAETKGFNYVEAAFEIALQESIITSEEYEEYFKKRRYYKKEIETIEKIYVEKDREKNKSNKASIDVLDKVYRIFLELENSQLTDEHKDYLIKERGLSEDVIKERMYATYPTQGTIKKLMEKLEENKGDFLLKKTANEVKAKNEELDLSFSDAILYIIPGFYQKQVKGEWVWAFPSNKGILIPIRNAEGKIEGLQIRRDKKDEMMGRYIWFSSAFAEYSDKFRFGTSSGAPLDALYPKDKINSVLFITEGRFKSEIISQKLESSCLSIQGVGNWQGIDKEIKKMEKYLGEKYKGFRGFTHIYIAFDSDMSYKYQVYSQLKKMSDFIENSVKLRESKAKRPSGVYYLHWSDGYKGIDDLLFNSNCKNSNECGALFKVYRKKYWDKKYDIELNKVLKDKDVKYPRELSEDDLININIDLE